MEENKDSLFKHELIPHLKSSYFFRPSFVAGKMNFGKYRIYLRQAADANCNLKDIGKLQIMIKDSESKSEKGNEKKKDKFGIKGKGFNMRQLLGSEESDDDEFNEIHSMDFMNAAMYSEIMKQSPNFMDCSLIDLNFEGDFSKDISQMSLDTREQSVIPRANYFEEVKEDDKEKGGETSCIDVKFQFSSDSFEWKQGWWIDCFIFEPILELP
mmetsp:Transcript_8093/g.7547  ORF Transcript_8093/g.7547 Transcript_8093/m.7547 type:complete len:212 (-) Transcript_8093:68-703(-)